MSLLLLPPMVYCKLNLRWDFSVGLSKTQLPESMSFVNKMHTSQGSTYIAVVACQISQYIADHINARMSQELYAPITTRAV